jgi:hypothetical protein
MSTTKQGFNFVVKIPKNPSDMMKELENRKSHAVMACLMAILYNKKCSANKVYTCPIFYAPPVYFKLKDGSFMGYDTVYAESCIA